MEVIKQLQYIEHEGKANCCLNNSSVLWNFIGQKDNAMCSDCFLDWLHDIKAKIIIDDKYLK